MGDHTTSPVGIASFEPAFDDVVASAWNRLCSRVSVDGWDTLGAALQTELHGGHRVVPPGRRQRHRDGGSADHCGQSGTSHRRAVPRHAGPPAGHRRRGAGEHRDPAVLAADLDIRCDLLDRIPRHVWN